MMARRVAAVAVAAVAVTAAAAGAASASSGGLPGGMHWRYVRGPVRDCGPMHGKPAVVVWRGSGDMQSALFCPDGTVQPG